MRQFAHRVIGIAFWLLLVGLWVVLALEGKASGEAFRDTGLQLAALMGVVLTVTIWWIRHNVGIYRRKGARRGRPEVRPRTDEDRLGRPITWAVPEGAPAASDAHHLVVEIVDDIKSYRQEG